MRVIIAMFLLVLLSGCATWATSDVRDLDGNQATKLDTAKSKSPANILITEKDIPGKKYKIVGDIDVTVNKTTIFHQDPTTEMVNEKLREKAAEVGADAVILVRYGAVGISALSWGSLNGKGRAIVFEQ